MFYFSITKLFSSDIFLIRRYGSLLQPFLDVGKILGSLHQIRQLGCGVQTLKVQISYFIKNIFLLYFSLTLGLIVSRDSVSWRKCSSAQLREFPAKNWPPLVSITFSRLAWILPIKYFPEYQNIFLSTKVLGMVSSFTFFVFSALTFSSFSKNVPYCNNNGNNILIIFPQFWLSLTIASCRSFITSTTSSTWAFTKLELPAMPYSLARNLAMAMDWPMVTPSISRTGSWPNGREGFRLGISSVREKYEKYEPHNQPGSSYLEQFSCPRTPSQHRPAPSWWSLPGPEHCSGSALSWTFPARVGVWCGVSWWVTSKYWQQAGVGSLSTNCLSPFTVHSVHYEHSTTFIGIFILIMYDTALG